MLLKQNLNFLKILSSVFDIIVQQEKKKFNLIAPGVLDFYILPRIKFILKKQL
jgi:hypothetical protein